MLKQRKNGLMGIVMPRTVSDSDGMAEIFEEACVEKGVAKGLAAWLLTPLCRTSGRTHRFEY